MNVTDDLMRQYIKVFNNTFLETANANLPKGQKQFLSRSPLISSGSMGYISTQFGAGLEYLGEESSGIKIKRSSVRIEDLFTGAPAHVRRLSPGINITGRDTVFENLTSEGFLPFRLASEDASVRFIEVRFIDQGRSRDVEYAELYGNRTAEFWSEVNAVKRAKDEVYHALFDLNEAKKRDLPLSDYLRLFKRNTVLVLGDYCSDGRGRLEFIKNELLN